MRRDAQHYVIRELQIKTTRYHYTSIRMAKIQNTWQHQMLAMNSHSLMVGVQNGTATLEDSLAVSYKTNHTPWYLPK